MNKLVNEVLQIIFDDLDFLEDKINCRLVSKRFKHVIDNTDSNYSLFISERNSYSNSRRWFINDYNYSSKQKQYEYYLPFYMIHKLTLQSTRCMLLNSLKSIIILIRSTPDNNQMFIRFLNNLINYRSLIKLSIDNFNFLDNRYYLDRIEINSVSLKIFYLNNFIIDNLTIDCPKLECLFLKLNNSQNEFTNLTIQNQSIKLLKINFYHPSLDQLIGLEYLFIRNIKYLSNDLLLKLSNLKQLHFEDDFNEREYLRFYDQLIRQKTEFNCINLMIFFRNIQLTDYTSIRNLVLSDGSLEFYRRNSLSDQLSIITYLNEIDIENGKFYLIDNFFNRTNNLKTIYLKDHIYEAKLIQLINNYNYFINFSFDNCYLSKKFYNQLPISILNLKLKNNFYLDGRRNIDDLYGLMFIFKLIKLEYFKVDLNLNPIFLNNLINKLKHIYFIEYKPHFDTNQIIKIKIYDLYYLGNKYELYVSNHRQRFNCNYFFNLNHLINYISRFIYCTELDKMVQQSLIFKSKFERNRIGRRRNRY